MASKQLGKLRQWAGEVISVRDRTILSDEFRELEHDVELRRRGLWKLHVASEEYHYSLSKKKVSEAVDTEEKLLSIDALGVVMIQHGEEFGDESAFGTSLVSLGRAHCQVATLQEAFSVLFHETYLASIQRAEDDIKEYQSQRKKLDSRRLTYDAALTKLEKITSSKKEKEKDRVEAEDEYELAKSRYEECAEDVRVRMYAIQENELEQLRDLTGFLDNELRFAEQYVEVLRDVKSNWVDEATLTQMESAKRPRAMPKPMSESRFSSLRHKKSISKRSAAGSDETESEGEMQTKSQLKKSSSVRKGESGSNSRPPSRPSSRAERKRADSVVSVGADKEKEKSDKAKSRMSVAGWMGSLTGRGKKEKIDTLMQDRDDDDSDNDVLEPKSSKSRRQSNSSPTKTKPTTSANVSPVIPSRTFRLPAQKKIAVALHDFNAGSSDELSFKAGDQISVQNEVLDGWWMGELNGKTGLFPTTYTEIINSSSSSLLSKPPLPARPPPAHSSVTPARNSQGGSAESLTSKPRPTPKWLAAQATGESLASDDDHPFGDHFIASSRSPLNGAFYPESIASSGGEDEDGEDKRLVPGREESDDGHYDYRVTPASTSSRPSISARKLSLPGTKRAPPPPPPPRRGLSSMNTSQPPPIPGRGFLPSNASTRSNSTNTSFVSIRNDETLTNSPFD